MTSLPNHREAHTGLIGGDALCKTAKVASLLGRELVAASSCEAPWA